MLLCYQAKVIVIEYDFTELLLYLVFSLPLDRKPKLCSLVDCNLEAPQLESCGIQKIKD